MARILITEDEDSLRSFVARALRLDGHETYEAADGAEGLERLQVAVAVFALAGGLAGIAGASAPGPGVENPLDISHVTLTTEESGGMKVLVVRGIVENRSGGTVAVPDIRADLVTGERMVASTIIAPPAIAMFSGHSRGFAARLPHPGGKDPQIKLSFTTAAVARP